MKTLTYKWILFLISPLLSVFFAFKEFTSSHSKNIFWAFCAFYGLTFSTGGESIGSDIHTYHIQLQQFYQQYELSFFQLAEMYSDSIDIDVFALIISYLLSRVTDSLAMLTLVYASIFGFFYSRNIWYIFDLLGNKLNLLSKLLLIALVLVVPIWNINGIRMYLAFHVFIYGLLPFIFEQKKGMLVFSFLSILIHFSFIIPISVLGIYLILGNRWLNLYFILFIGSIFVSEIEVSKINQFTGQIKALEIFTERSAGYTDENRVEEFREEVKNNNANWYVAGFRNALKWFLIIVLVYLFFFGNKKIRVLPIWRTLFSMSLLFFIVPNLISNLPSGVRFYIFPFFLGIILEVLYISEFEDKKIIKLTNILTPALLLFILISIRNGLYFTSLTTIIGNPIIAVFSIGENIPLNGLIK